MAKAKLTQTQKFILKKADEYDGLVSFGAGDRKGTRCAGISESGVPVIVAYSMPEYFLKNRGLLEKAGGNHSIFTYRITPAGRAALAQVQP